MTNLRILLLAGLAAVGVMWVATTLSGPIGWIGAAIVVAVIYSDIHFHAGELILSLHRAAPASGKDAAIFRECVERAAAHAAVAPPEIWIVNTPVANSLVIGDAQRSVIAVTQGLLTVLEHDELAAVATHEVARIRTGDANMECVVAWIASLFGSGRLARTFVRLNLSPRHEYEEDSEATRHGGDAASLARALEKMRASHHGEEPGIDHPATHHLWMVNPGSPYPVFETHLATGRRIQRLRERSS